MEAPFIQILAGSAALSVAGCVASAKSKNGHVSVDIDASAKQRSISPEIYGASYAGDAGAEYRCPVDRIGGNNMSRYNWLENADNKGADWFFQSIGMPDTTPGQHVTTFCTTAKRAGAVAMITVPMLGYVAKLAPNRGKLWSFSVKKYGHQEKTDAQYCPDAGNGKQSNGKNILGNNPLEANVAAPPTFFIPWLKNLASSMPNLKYICLDNEPGLWHETHRDVVPAGVSLDELWKRSLETSQMCKAIAPKVNICGPEEWGWTGYMYSPLDAQFGKENGWHNPFKPLPDKRNHGNIDPMTFLLRKFAEAEQAAGKRLLDVFTLHFYPQGGEFSGDTSPAMCQRRNRSTRALWDPQYKDETWIADTVQLIPRMKELVQKNYPGTRLGITEYSWGADEHINGATAQADVLGILGREGLDLACRWTSPKQNSFAFKAIQMYTNPGGHGHGFGNTSVFCKTAQPDDVAAFAALDTTTDTLTIMLINKLDTDAHVSINMKNFTSGATQVYTLGKDNIIKRSQVAELRNQITLSGPSIKLLRVARKK